MPADPTEKAAAAARALLAAESVGLLSTISVRRAGTPYGSVTPYALSAGGAPLLLLSGLAGARLSLMGRAVPVPDDAAPDARARYLARWPRAADTLALADFSFWRFEIEEARFIAGFGEIRWLTADAFNG
jgi:heme iron utilization protein